MTESRNGSRGPVTAFGTTNRHGAGVGLRVLRVSHSAVVDAWRSRERELRARGHEVRLVSAKRWDEAGNLVTLVCDQGEDVVGAATLGSHPALFLFDPRPLWSELGRPWDVLDVHEEPYSLATAEVFALAWLRSRLSRRPLPALVLYSAQNIPKRYPWPFRKLESGALRRAAGISVCNEATAHIVRRKGARGVVRNIPLGIDPQIFRPLTSHKTKAPGEIFRVGFAGRLAAHKGVGVLLRALASDPAMLLEIAGDGPERSQLVAAAEGNTRIVFRGPLSGSELVSFYRSIDVLAVPSLETPGWIEQFGRVAVEAMACGTPVVASDTGALPEVVGGAGLLVPPGDSAALHDALARVRDERGCAERLVAAGRERARSCSWAAVADGYEKLYVDALALGAGDRAPRAPRDVSTTVVVVAYGAPGKLAAALGVLDGHYHVIVVDNSSSAEVRAVAESAGADYVDPGYNGGFAAGVNVGLRFAEDSDVLLLNPDATITVNHVEELRRALATDDTLASVAPSQVDADGRRSRVTWPFPTPLRAAAEAVGLGAVAKRFIGPTYVIGAVLLLRAEAIADVGPFDDRFFLYAEETDWAWRAVHRGWRHAEVRSAQAFHEGGGTSADPARRETHFHASQERYFRKHFGALRWGVVRASVVMGAAVRSLVLPTGPRRAQARRRLALYARGALREEGRLRGK